MKGRLTAEDLITHVAKPEQCDDIYTMLALNESRSGLADRPQQALGVVFEW